MTPLTSYLGSCLCGEIGFELKGEPKKFTCCHCWNCRKSTGAASQQNIVFPDSSLSITRGEKFLSVYQDGKQNSGLPLFRYFCAKCGANLFVTRRTEFGQAGPDTLPEDHKILAVYYGAIDWRVIKNEDGTEVKEKVEEPPTIEFHVRDKLHWVTPIEGAEQVHTKPGA